MSKTFSYRFLVLAVILSLAAAGFALGDKQDTPVADSNKANACCPQGSSQNQDVCQPQACDATSNSQACSASQCDGNGSQNCDRTNCRPQPACCDR